MSESSAAIGSVGSWQTNDRERRKEQTQLPLSPRDFQSVNAHITFVKNAPQPAVRCAATDADHEAFQAYRGTWQMGLDAFVACNCYREGRTTPPPVPRELIVLEDDGTIELDLAYDGNEEQFAAFDQWMWGPPSCCEHEEALHAARVRVANWGGYRAFQQALGQVGWERFPTLHDELPNSNDGTTSPAAAALALEELAAFRDSDLGHNWFLVDDDSNETIYEYIAAYEGVFAWDGLSGFNVGIDPRGLFIVERNTQPPREVFRAMRLEQRLLDPAREAGGGVELVDIDTGQRLESPTAVPGRQIPWPDGRMQNDEGKVRTSYPRRLRVEERAISTAEFAYAVEPLEEVFRAAVMTGNPVCWT